MNISFKQYRAIDLGIMAIIAVVFEAITVKATQWFPDQPYTLSPAVTVLCIVMMRWGGYAAIHAVLSGFVYCLASGARPEQYATYCIGNLAALLVLFLFKMFGKKKVRDKLVLTILYIVSAFVAVQVGRWAVSLCFGTTLDAIIDFLLLDSISLLFAVVVTLIARRIDGLFEDQKSYLIRTQAERLSDEADKYE